MNDGQEFIKGKRTVEMLGPGVARINGVDKCISNEPHGVMDFAGGRACLASGNPDRFDPSPRSISRE